MNLKRIDRCSLEFRGTGVARKYGPGGPPVPPCPKPAFSPVPHPPQRKGREQLATLAARPLRSRLGAGGAHLRSPPARRVHLRIEDVQGTSRIAQETRRRAQQTIAQHRTRGLQSDWSASQHRDVHTKQRSRTRNLGFKKRESPRQEAISLNVRLMVRLA